jgi:hypothetical protein
MVQLVVGGGLLAILLSRRREVHATLGSLAMNNLGPVVFETRAMASPATWAASRAHLTGLMAGVADMGYLLIGDAVLGMPLLAALTPLVGPVAAAILVTGVAALALALLLVRLHAAAGLVGVALGMLLSAPLLLALPLLPLLRRILTMGTRTSAARAATV